MRFAFVAVNRWTVYGGSEVLWARTATLLAERGHAVFCCVPEKQLAGPHVRRLRDAGATVIKVHKRAPYGSPVLAARMGRKLFGNALPRPLREADLTVISQAHTFDGLSWAWRMRELGRRYCLISQAGSEHLQPADDEADRHRLAQRDAAASFFVSQATLELMRRQIADDIPAGEVAYNPVQVDAGAGPLPWPEGDGDEVRLASVARLEQFPKGHDLLLEVMALDKWRGRPLTLDLFGDGENRRIIERQIGRLNLGSVRLAGKTDDVTALWRDHHGLLLGSRVEGLPLALAEAMLLGRVPVVTDVAGNAELVTDGQTGFLAAAPTADLIDAALDRAWARRADWPAIGRAAAARARDVLPPDPVAALADRLETLVKDDPTSRT